jgi:Peptidase family M23
MPPPRTRLLLVASVPVVLAVVLLAVLLPRAAAARVARERWRWPVYPHEVARGFRYAPSHPFAAAQRRGVDLRAAPGSAVRSACAGRVTYAGPVPGGRGLGVSVRCGTLVATHLGLRRMTVRRGARVVAGTRLGSAGPAGRVRLGARRAADRLGYVDPLGLLVEEGPRGAPVAPLGRAPRGPRVRVPLVRPPLPAPRPPPVAVARDGARVPAAGWAGLVVLAAGLPLGALVRRSRRRRAARVVAGAAVAER